MTRTVFPEVMTMRRYNRPCSVCGKKTVRTRRFAQTINPWHPSITYAMDAAERQAAVRASVHEEADAWTPDHRHEKCKGEQP